MTTAPLTKKISIDRREQSKKHERNAIIYNRDKELAHIIATSTCNFDFEQCLCLQKVQNVVYLIHINIFTTKNQNLHPMLNQMMSDIVQYLSAIYQRRRFKSRHGRMPEMDDFDVFVHENVHLVDKYIDEKLVYDISRVTKFYNLRSTLLRLSETKKTFYLVTGFRFYEIYLLMYIFGLDMFVDRLKFVNSKKLGDFMEGIGADRILFFEKWHVCRDCRADYCFDVDELGFFK